MKHAALFFLLGLLMCFTPWLHDGWWTWIVLWLGMDMILLSRAYARRDASVFGKRADGSLAPARALLFLPYLLFTWGVWRLCLLLPEPKTHQINATLTVGRRLVGGHERPAGITAVLDMTAEFSEPASVRSGIRYIVLPTLDASAPSPEALLATLRTLKPDEHAFIHCAQGHGRTGLAALALLLLRGEVPGIEEGLAMLRNIRPGIGLSPEQYSCLIQCLAQLRAP
ncbi:protein-tyrosine phosphatase family protein [Prosthecobacter sp.]|uniref:phosphatase domain-containing protein n=1 Tax=Prosthecobacter sp. TaxID=1965333 RepID=UPI00378304E6